MDESLPTPLNGEATPSVPATDESAVTEAATSEVATLEQPAEETTGEQPKASRAQARISELTHEKNYWKDLALQNAPSEEKPKPADDSEGIGLDDIAEAVVSRLEDKARSSRAKNAEQQMLADAAQASAEFPQLDQDERLARRVIAIAQADGISITEAARDYLGRTTVSRTTTEQASRESIATPPARKVSTGTVAPIDIASMSEAEKAANWGKYIQTLSQGE